MAMTQEEYDKYVAQAEKLGVPVNPDVQVQQPVQSPVQAPVQTPQPVPSEAGFMEQFKQDYANIGQVMDKTSPARLLDPRKGDSPEYSGWAKSLVEVIPDLGEMGGTIAGMAHGARVGSSGGLYGTVGGGLIGAMMGSGIGESVRQMFMNEFDPAKVIDKMLVSGMFEGGFAGLGPMMHNLGRGIESLRQGKELTYDQILGLDELLKELEKNGITLTPAQLTGSNFQQTLEKIGKAGFGGEAKFGALYEAQERFIRDRMDKLATDVGNPSFEEAGRVFQEAMEAADDQLIKWAQPQFTKLNKAARGVHVSLASTQQTLRSALKRSKAGRRAGASNRLDNDVEELYNFVLGDVQNTNFENLFSTIAEVTKQQRKAQLATDQNPALIKAQRDVLELLYADAEKAAAKAGSGVLDQYKQIKAVYKETKDSLNTSAIKSVVKAAPEHAGALIYKTGNVTAVKEAFNALDEAAKTAKRVGETFDAEGAKDALRAGYINQFFKKADEDTAIDTARKLASQLKNDQNVSNTFEAMLTPKQQADVMKVLGWAGQLEKNSAGNFSLIVRGRQSGELNKVASELSNSAQLGLNLYTVGKGLAFLAAPAKLAQRAVGGKVTQEYLSQMKTIITKFDSGQFDTSDAVVLFGLWAKNYVEGEEIPKELRIPKLSDKQALEAHAARARIVAQYEKAGAPVPEELLKDSPILYNPE